MSTSTYHTLAIDRWSACSAAGDALATWQACQQGHSKVLHSDALGWHATAAISAATAATERGQAILKACLNDLPPLTGNQLAVAVSMSKGDTAAWLGAGAPQPKALIAHPPGGCDALVARHCGQRWFLPASPVAACSTGLYAVLAAADAVERGLADHAVAGAIDASLQPALLAGFASLGVITSQPPQAMAEATTGFAPGEGGALLGLRRVKGKPSGWYLRGGVRLGDASHPTACHDGAVLRRCLSELWRVLPDPDLIVTHGTGTAAGDRYERDGLDHGPWQHAPRLVCKPIIGHCLGASGAVELAAALAGDGQRIWKLGLGFGGHIAGLALERCDAA